MTSTNEYVRPSVRPLEQSIAPPQSLYEFITTIRFLCKTLDHNIFLQIDVNILSDIPDKSMFFFAQPF